MGKSKVQKRASKRKRENNPYDMSKGESSSAGAKPGVSLGQYVQLRGKQALGRM